MWLIFLLMLQTPQGDQPQRTVANEEVHEAVDNALEYVREERADGNKQDVPVRFPVGARGQRIQHFADLALAGEEAVLQAHLKQAGNDGAKLREIISGISRSENKKLLPLVRPYLKWRNPEVRAITALAYGKLGTGKHIDELKPLLKDKHMMVRASAQMACETLEAFK